MTQTAAAQARLTIALMVVDALDAGIDNAIAALPSARVQGTIGFYRATDADVERDVTYQVSRVSGAIVRRRALFGATE